MRGAGDIAARAIGTRHVRVEQHMAEREETARHAKLRALPEDGPASALEELQSRDPSVGGVPIQGITLIILIVGGHYCWRKLLLIAGKEERDHGVAPDRVEIWPADIASLIYNHGMTL